MAADERAVQAERQRAEHELAQAKRLAEEAHKREAAERARAEAADRATRRQRAFSLALLVLLLAGLIEAWLWQKGYNLNRASLRIKSLVVSIHVLPEMVPVTGGTFQMGDVEKLGDAWCNPVHPVTITPFSMGTYEVTFDEYDAFAIATGRDLPNDQKWGRGRQPVMNVSWDEAKAYAEWLSTETGNHYRLPSESEWEYAARSGAKQEVWAGTSEESRLGDYAVFRSNKTDEVGKKSPNAFGLHDMSGNVWEWVEDCWHTSTDYSRAPTGGSPGYSASMGNCVQRVIRGGAWNEAPAELRGSARGWNYPRDRDDFQGFRLAQDREP